MFIGDYPPVDGDFAISFYDLIDVYVAGQLRNHGVSLQNVRKVYTRMQQDLVAQHPFCRQEVLTDGKSIFTRNVESSGRDELIEVLTEQGVFPDIILPFLRNLDYESLNLLARRWRIDAGVIVDPGICFGAPVVASTGLPTAILATAYQANGADPCIVADWYNVNIDDVMAAVRFESQSRVAA